MKIYKRKKLTGEALLKRKAYLREYRIKNRQRVYDIYRLWLIRTGRIQDKPKRVFLPGKPKNIQYEDFKEGRSKQGRKYELEALKLLKGSIDCNVNSFKGKYDIIWNGFNIDVKSRNIFNNKFWPFSGRGYVEVDYYLLFCLKDGNIHSTYLIPRDVYRMGITISISEKCKYKKYIISFL